LVLSKSAAVPRKRPIHDLEEDEAEDADESSGTAQGKLGSAKVRVFVHVVLFH
jgi:hypothetical protein